MERLRKQIDRIGLLRIFRRIAALPGVFRAPAFSARPCVLVRGIGTLDVSVRRRINGPSLGHLTRESPAGFRQPDSAQELFLKGQHCHFFCHW